MYSVRTTFRRKNGPILGSDLRGRFRRQLQWDILVSALKILHVGEDISSRGFFFFFQAFLVEDFLLFFFFFVLR